MREGAKQRLVGAVVIVALAVIFVPMLFERESLSPPPIQESMPLPPAFDPDLPSEVFLGPESSGVGGLDDSELTDTQPLALPPAGDLEPAAPGSLDDEAVADLGPDNPAAGLPSPVSTAKPLPSPHQAGTRQPAPPVSRPPPAPEPVVPRAPADGMPSWVVQVASLGTQEGAAELEAKLRKGGFSAFVEKADVNGKLYYRVAVGPEIDRASVERTAGALRERMKLDTLIRSYP